MDAFLPGPDLLPFPFRPIRLEEEVLEMYGFLFNQNRRGRSTAWVIPMRGPVMTGPKS